MNKNQCVVEVGFRHSFGLLFQVGPTPQTVWRTSMSAATRTCVRMELPVSTPPGASAVSVSPAT